MPIIYSYPSVTAQTSDLVILSDVSASGKPTKTATASSMVTLTKDVLDLNQFKLDGEPFTSTTLVDGDTINFDGTSWKAGPTAANVVTVVSVTATTAVSNYVATVSGISALSREVVYKVVFDSTNTISPVTLNINGYGAYALQRGTETGFEDIPISFLLAGPDVFITWDGDRFQVYINNGTSTNPRSISDVEFVNDAPVTAAHGGITKGQTFGRKSTGRGYTMQEMFDIILYPYQSPSLSSLGITGQGPTVEVGYTVPSGAKTFTWSRSNAGNIEANSGVITDTTAGTTLATGVAIESTTSASVALPLSIQKTSGGATHKWQIAGTNSQGGSLPTSAYTITWLWRRYIGNNASTVIVEADILALSVNTSLSTSLSGTYTFPGGNYKYLCIPTSFPEPSSITSGGFPVAMAGTAEGYASGSGTYKYQTVSNVTNSQGEDSDYRVYRSLNQLNGSATFIVS